MTALERIRTRLADFPFVEVPAADDMATLEVERERLVELVRRLRDELGYETCTLVTAVDHYPAEPRFQLVHQFLSLSHVERVRIHCRVREDDATLPSIVALFPGASFFEREAFDMFGIRFDGHQGLRRLLMPDGYVYHPLRKDFPHQGIEPDRLYREWDRNRRQPQEQPR